MRIAGQQRSQTESPPIAARALACAAILVLAIGGVGRAAAAQSVLSVALEPTQITVGQSAVLTVKTLGAGLEAVVLPAVPGLELRIVEQTHHLETLHGAAIGTTTTRVRVTPLVAGVFSIPDLTPTAQPLVLRVNVDDAIGNAPSKTPAAAAPRTSAGETIHLTADGSAFLRLSLPKREVYVGESVPVEIELGLRPGFVNSLNGLPTLTSADFTLNNLSRQPERSERVVDGVGFAVLTWHSVLAPVRPGTFTLSVESPITIRQRTRPESEAKLEDQLGDPFLQNIYGKTIKKDIKVASPAVELDVLALPAEGRPDAFSGAVGSFRISSDLVTETAAVGDPLSLRMRVNGSGNFDRVDSAMLEHLDQWKTYPPKSTFTAGDSVGYQGEKRFEQALIAARAGPQTLPALSFSYFDPVARRYATVTAAPLHVTITPAPGEPSAPAPQSPAAADASGVAVAVGSLRPDHAVPATGVRSLRPLYLQTPFLGLPVALVLGFAGAAWRLRRPAARRPAGVAAGARRRRRRERSAVQCALAAGEAAAQAGDPAAFCAAARQLIAARLIETGAGGTLANLRALELIADAQRYADAPTAAVDWSQWLEALRRAAIEPEAA
jgi:hypothetical protein